MTKQFDQIYLVIDAVDECVEVEDMCDLILMLVEPDHGINIIAASRPKRSIEQAFQPIPASNRVSIQSAFVDEDIKLHVHQIMSKDKKMKLLPNDIKQEIEEALSKGARGMYKTTQTFRKS